LRTIIPRRSFLKSIPASLLAAMGLGRAKGATDTARAIGAVASPLKPMATVPAQGAATLEGIRAAFANRNPLLTRTPWVPVERADFRLCSHRLATAAEMPHHDKVTHGGRCGLTTVAEFRTQYCQEFRRPVPVDPGEFGLEFSMEMALQNLVDDIELAMYYGKAEWSGVPGDFVGIRTGGLRDILKTNRIVRDYPDGGLPPEFFVDALQACRSGGGEPNRMLISSDCVKNPHLELVRIPGESGVAFASDRFRGITFVECPLLKSRTAVALTRDEIYVRNKVDPHFSWAVMDNGCYEGWKATVAIDVVNEQHHCWAESRRAS
jgi:hypothetical protein